MQSGLHNPVFQINRSDKGDNELDPVGALAEVSRRPAPYLARVRSDGAKRVQSSISTAIRVASGVVGYSAKSRPHERLPLCYTDTKPKRRHGAVRRRLQARVAEAWGRRRARFNPASCLSPRRLSTYLGA